ncbi:Aspercryptin biosynthesis cluster-specific transcription regulator atnN [Colletotrichum aenigma]|uniref:Aspercryptin biosynthesis cluster-specific transcription regulator atnN n=1 Tax=Colletotrichum aenigma TaxID=1215731 RepID=UPI001872365C|nr:Aspercryptin biosynthesis cluster-specific transcription regulator atnN [Colletotrichum aenigma]KAF5507744.1 Aspercryptin biosynthesis cluster-specific transcription regulator atnN [Colletotrichum aenigma]
MARKGSRKVRTGCLTCKIRKIKCDEGKPFCNRCTSTGRKCDGYAVEPASVLRWQRPQTLQIDSSTNGEEARALQYYCEHVAPFIAGPTDPYYWTHLVVQFVNREPAVKHSVIAIGLLYGNMDGGTNTHLDGVALSHYNAAIFELNSLQNDNNGLVLVLPLDIAITALRCWKVRAQNRLYGITYYRYFDGLICFHRSQERATSTMPVR